RAAPGRRAATGRSTVGRSGGSLRGRRVRRRDAGDDAAGRGDLCRAHPLPRTESRLRRSRRRSGARDDQHRTRIVSRRPRAQRGQLRVARGSSPLSRQERRPQLGPAMSERRCPKCGSMYTDSAARFCPKDGSMLVEIQSKKSSAPPSSDSGTGARTPLPKSGLDRASSLSNQILDARYQVMKKLGEGGMSYVYLAKEISSGLTVAIKVLSPRLASDKSSVERLRREAGLAMRLDHPNVCRILRLGESEDGLIYLVMPFLKGELLSDREVRNGPMDIPLGVTLLKQMCAGLHHAHELQIIHRDLKPENVMLVPDDDGGGGTEHAVVMDFGLAKERRADPAIAKRSEE